MDHLMITTRTHKAAWQCGESVTGLPSCQEHLLGASGRIHSSSLASLSSGGSFSRLPLPRRAPERWGHPADLRRVSAEGVSEGMVGPAKGEERLSVQRVSRFLQKRSLYSSHLGTPAHPASSGCGAPLTQEAG